MVGIILASVGITGININGRTKNVSRYPAPQPRETHAIRSMHETPASYDNPFSLCLLRGARCQAAGHSGEVRSLLGCLANNFPYLAF